MRRLHFAVKEIHAMICRPRLRYRRSIHWLIYWFLMRNHWNVPNWMKFCHRRTHHGLVSTHVGVINSGHCHIFQWNSNKTNRVLFVAPSNLTFILERDFNHRNEAKGAKWKKWWKKIVASNTFKIYALPSTVNSSIHNRTWSLMRWSRFRSRFDFTWISYQLQAQIRCVIDAIRF